MNKKIENVVKNTNEMVNKKLNF